MLSLAIVSFSPCSLAISSRTGATILHGPHHSAQKSTRTGLSLPSTSSAKVASVTVTVLPAMVVCSPRGSLRVGAQGLRPGRSVRDNRRNGGCMPGSGGPSAEGSALAEGGGQPALGVDGRRGAGAGRGDGLPVDVVDDVTAGEDAFDVGPGGRVLDLHVALVVQLELADEQLAARVVADSHEDTRDRQLLGGAGADVGQLDAGDGLVAQDVGDLLAERPADLVVVLRPLLHDLGGAQLLPPVDDGHRLGEAGEEGGLLHRRVTATDHDDVLVEI